MDILILERVFLPTKAILDSNPQALQASLLTSEMYLVKHSHNRYARNAEVPGELEGGSFGAPPSCAHSAVPWDFHDQSLRAAGQKSWESVHREF